MSELRFLQLLHLAASALPVGAAAHSFGLEALVAENGLEVADLFLFFQEYLQEAGTPIPILTRSLLPALTAPWLC
jgi:urease accessory protein